MKTTLEKLVTITNLYMGTSSKWGAPEYGALSMEELKAVRNNHDWGLVPYRRALETVEEHGTNGAMAYLEVYGEWDAINVIKEAIAACT